MAHLLGWAGGRLVVALVGWPPARPGDLPPQDVTMLGGGAVEVLGPKTSISG